MKYPFKLNKYSNKCYRNIYTAHPSQDLYDDIVDPEDYDAIFELEEHSVLIEKNSPNKDRIFQYGVGNELFTPFNPPWKEGRFGDGRNYGVLYCAEEKETSLIEAFWHWVRWTKNVHAVSAKDWISTDRCLYELEVKSDAFVDLMQDQKNKIQLTSADYSFCQKLAIQARAENVHGLRAPSARNESGVCIPIFEKSAVKSDRKIKFLKFSCNVRTGELRIEGARVNLPFGYEDAIE